MSLQEVRQALGRAAPDKAPGPDGISNRALQQAIPIIGPYLAAIFNECVVHSYCPSHFRHSTTVVLRKPGKGDYTDPKAYHPIALLSTIRKALEAVIAARISYLVERHSLLPNTHIGGRKGRSTEHALHLLYERVHAEWRRGNVASLLTLDVSGTYDNMSHRRLLHNLRKRRLPQKITNWVASFLQGRLTTMTLMEGEMRDYQLPTGIPQGSPLSPILYLFYNANHIDATHTQFPEGTLVTGYVEDICILVWGRDTEENCQKLAAVHQVAERWESTYASRFAPARYGLVHLVSRHRRANRHQRH